MEALHGGDRVVVGCAVLRRGHERPFRSGIGDFMFHERAVEELARALVALHNVVPPVART